MSGHGQAAAPPHGHGCRDLWASVWSSPGRKEGTGPRLMGVHPQQGMGPWAQPGEQGRGCPAGEGRSTGKGLAPPQPRALPGAPHGLSSSVTICVQGKAPQKQACMVPGQAGPSPCPCPVEKAVATAAAASCVSALHLPVLLHTRPRPLYLARAPVVRVPSSSRVAVGEAPRCGHRWLNQCIAPLLHNVLGASDSAA